MNKLFILVITIFITVSCSTNDSKVKTLHDKARLVFKKYIGDTVNMVELLQLIVNI